MTLSHQFEVKCGGMPQDAGTLVHQRKTPQFNNALNRIDQLNIPNQKLQRSIPMFAKECQVGIPSSFRPFLSGTSQRSAARTMGLAEGAGAECRAEPWTWTLVALV